MKRVKRIPEAGNGGEVSLFLLQGIVKRAWPQEQPHARLRDMVSSRNRPQAGAIPFHKRLPSFQNSAESNWANRRRHRGSHRARLLRIRDGPNKLVGRSAGTKKL